jgi:hypothetical protein
MLLVRTNNNGSIDVVGSMQAGFASSEDVEVRDGAVFVGGVKQDWTLFPNMVITSPAETLTPTPQLPEINPFSSATTWSPEIQARFKDVLTNPWTATADEKAAYDTYLMGQIQLTLKADGVANADQLQGNDLITAIAEHLPPITLTGKETPEDLAAMVVELPLSVHEALRTDVNNLVGWHHEDGRYVEGKMDPRGPNSQPPPEFRGPLQKSLNDWGYYYAYYGFGATTSPKPDHAQLLKDMGYLSTTSTTNPNNYGYDFYGEKIPAIGVIDAPEGDIAFLFRIPGTDPNTAVGVMLRMYDGPRVAYTEVYLPLSTVLTTTANDTCLKPGLGLLQTIPCPAGLSIPSLGMEDPLLTSGGNGSLYFLLKLMRLYNNNPHVTLFTTGGIVLNGELWIDGIPVAITMNTPNTDAKFYTNP